MNELRKLIKFNVLSRMFGLDRRAITSSYIPRKHWERMDKIIKIDIPKSWEEFKKNYKK